MGPAILTASLALTPRGRLLFTVADGTLQPPEALLRRLEGAFGRGSGHGLLDLGAAEVGTALPADFGYWRDFGARLVTAICTHPDLTARHTPIPAPALRELEALAAAAPPMTGAEYLTAAVLEALWTETATAFRAELAESKASVQVFLQRKSPAWHLVGRVHFNLAENRGDDLYEVRVTVGPSPRARWSAICKDCSGAIDSLVELLQGRFSKGVMTRLCEEKTGLFPSPKDILFTCSCPDWASMCKHVAAVLYGIGARLDHQPELLFTLRKVNQQDLIAKAGSSLAQKRKAPAGAKVLASDDLSAMFGIEMAPPTPAKWPAASAVPRKPSPAATVAGSSKRKEPTPPAKWTKIAPTRKPGDEERRLTPKKRRAIAERMRRYWAEWRADARRRKTSGSL